MTIYLSPWIPIGPGDSEIWIETEEDRKREIEEEVKIETEYDIENETEKENK